MHGRQALPPQAISPGLVPLKNKFLYIYNSPQRRLKNNLWVTLTVSSPRERRVCHVNSRAPVHSGSQTLWHYGHWISSPRAFNLKWTPPAYMFSCNFPNLVKSQGWSLTGARENLNYICESKLNCGVSKAPRTHRRELSSINGIVMAMGSSWAVYSYSKSRVSTPPSNYPDSPAL